MNDLDIKEIRAHLGVTQAELAKMLGVSERTGHSDMKAMKPYMAIVDELKAKAMERFNNL